MNAPWIIAGFLLGIGSSLHCIGMCGPLAIMIPFGESKWKNNLFLFIYLFSKATGYGFIGLLFSFVGANASFLIGQNVLSFLSGIFILLILAFNLNRFNFLPLNKISLGFNTLINNLRIKGEWYHYSALGFFNSLLPCGMVLVASAASLAAPDVIHGFLFMVSFGIGTMPVLILVKKMQGLVSIKSRTNLKYASSIVGVILSVMLIFRSITAHTSVKTKDNEILICKPMITK